jgi:hypothetical protein
MEIICIGQLLLKMKCAFRKSDAVSREWHPNREPCNAAKKIILRISKRSPQSNDGAKARKINEHRRDRREREEREERERESERKGQNFH